MKPVDRKPQAMDDGFHKRIGQDGIWICLLEHAKTLALGF
jgi:hypothetical protein